jgi:DNA modification methylase
MKIHTGDVASTLRRMRPNTFHGCLTDPPYGLSFMGKQWDKGVPSAETWAEVLRVLKPGSFLLAFGGTRTYHRLTCAIEDAGFEIRDCVMWLYGSGFPKSHDISKGIDKRREWYARASVSGLARNLQATLTPKMHGQRATGKLMWLTSPRPPHQPHKHGTATAQR